jgi:hypothetical protein
MLPTKHRCNLFSPIFLFLFSGFVSAQIDPTAAKYAEA